MFSFIKDSLSKGFDKLKEKFGFKKSIFTEEDLKLVETTLLENNFGSELTKKLIKTLEKSKNQKVSLQEILYTNLFETFNEVKNKKENVLKDLDETYAYMLIGINGSGKTTSIIKLAKNCNKNYKTIVIAADTFRAAAQDQIVELCKKYSIDFYSDNNIKDPSAMIYKGCTYANDNFYNKVIIDTSGRMHSKDNLIKELMKIQKVTLSKIENKKLKTFIVLDALQGRALIDQVSIFNKDIKIDGIILTKLDAGVKPGTVFSIVDMFQLPIIYISKGQHETDLVLFDEESFIKKLLFKD